MQRPPAGRARELRHELPLHAGNIGQPQRHLERQQLVSVERCDGSVHAARRRHRSQRRLPESGLLKLAAHAVGSYSLAQSVTLSNTGNAALTISSIATTGDFTQTSRCGLVLEAASSCTVDVSFAPTATGPRNGSLSVFSSAASSPTLADLSGTGGTASSKPMRLALAAASVTVTVTVKEGAGSVTFAVNRSGSFDGAVSVQFATADGSAIAGQDYAAVSGTLSWAPSDSEPLNDHRAG